MTTMLKMAAVAIFLLSSGLALGARTEIECMATVKQIIQYGLHRLPIMALPE